MSLNILQSFCFPSPPLPSTPFSFLFFFSLPRFPLPSLFTAYSKMVQRRSEDTLSSLPRRNSLMAYTHQNSNHFGGIGGPGHTSSPARLASNFFNALLATALFRCWHIIIFFVGWATMVTLINEKVTKLSFQSTLLTVYVSSISVIKRVDPNLKSAWN